METKERFLKEIGEIKARKLAKKLACRYLNVEVKLEKRIEMIRNSIRTAPESYPYVNVPRNIKRKINIIKHIKF
jgi:hypothetical protein